jgi:hypothetical protein
VTACLGHIAHYLPPSGESWLRQQRLQRKICAHLQDGETIRRLICCLLQELLRLLDVILQGHM